MDELAKEAGMDPLEFRRKIMAKHPKHLAVLNLAAEKIGWGTPPPAGVHRGIAQHMGFGSYIAAAAEVSVTGNKVKVHRIVGVTDPGYAVNPAQIERQIAGSFVYGLTGLFLGGNTVKDGRIEQENFDTYDMMRLAQMPKVEAYVAPSHDGVWGGVGEPTICVAPPAVLNAIAAATGTRYRTFPLRDHGLSMA
jgi:isoquinoline 1-oxidoreductase beta subunit